MNGRGGQPPRITEGRRFLANKFVKCWPVNGLRFEQLGRDEFELLAVRNQSFFGFLVSGTEQMLDFLIHFASRLLAAIALNLELLPVQESRLPLRAMDQAQALAHSVHRNHLAREGGGPFKIILRASTDLAEHNLLCGTATQHAANAVDERTTRKQELIFSR